MHLRSICTTHPFWITISTTPETNSRNSFNSLRRDHFWYRRSPAQSLCLHVSHMSTLEVDI